MDGSNQRGPETSTIFTFSYDHADKNTEQDHKSAISGYYFTMRCSQATISF